MLKSLEDYIVEMENRSSHDEAQAQNMSEDIWTQLQQKENDIVLAAELGKALLEKNEELRKQQEVLVEEYSKKLEAVEQDRHILRRKLHSKESELDARIIELQNDVLELTSKVNAKDNLLKQLEREKSSLVAELTAQNTRLTTQLKQESQKQQHLRSELDKYKEQLMLGKHNFQEHIRSTVGLRDELDMLTEKNKDIEIRLQMAEAERDSISVELEEASDRIRLMKMHAREQDARYQQSLKEYSLPQEKMSIEERVSDGEHRSLLSEMDVSEPTLSQECLSVYRQLRSLVSQLRSHSDDDSGLHSDCSSSSLDDSSRFSPGLLSEVAQELVSLVLDTDIVNILESLEQARRQILEQGEELNRRSGRLRELTSKASVCEVELAAAVEERDRARHDASYSSLAQDEAVMKARDERDIAVQRRTKVEVELARTRVELMQASSQLIESIQQKVELSQQLEQWQMDMEELLNEQLKNKLSNQEIKMRKTSEEPIAPPQRKLLRFFYR
ncbi:unnamed protein product [Phaedon cochleariae]|uniref:Bicaudal D-related protein homolog n=1 Tax=Phaedon cochleariae TaxID=80249 RepID=A0A9P0GNF1_PHACE|nr:unnamed protein product [Phaedon cochleariae]